MKIAKIIAALISSLMLGAHFLHSGSVDLALLCCAVPFLILVKRRWALDAFALFLAAGSVVWVVAVRDLIAFRMIHGLPWARLALIMGPAAAFTAFSALAVVSLRRDGSYKSVTAGGWAGTASFFLTMAIIVPAKLKVSIPVLMLDRFFTGGGWIEILILCSYAAFITELMLTSAKTPEIRRKIWSAFSAVFFLQLLLGLAGLDVFFMTGKLHVPVPAVIIGGPLYRGGGYFMPALFASTLIVVGPAWCSHLCYFGAWDNNAAAALRTGVLKTWMKISRVVVLGIVVTAALALRYLGAPAASAALVATGFGIAGILVMIIVSRRKGIMVHCTAYCPLGLVADIAGRLSPFRVRIGHGCDQCGACARACRYGALSEEDIQKGRPGLSCSLCGDCLQACTKGAIRYHYLRLRAESARMLFTVLVISLHASFMGMARI